MLATLLSAGEMERSSGEEASSEQLGVLFETAVVRSAKELVKDLL